MAAAKDARLNVPGDVGVLAEAVAFVERQSAACLPREGVAFLGAFLLLAERAASRYAWSGAAANAAKASVDGVT